MPLGQKPALLLAPRVTGIFGVSMVKVLSVGRSWSIFVVGGRIQPPAFIVHCRHYYSPPHAVRDSIACS